MNYQTTSDITGRKSVRNSKLAVTGRNRSSAWKFPSRTGRPAHWVYPRCWTGSFSKPSRKSFQRNGNHTFTHTATGFARDARLIKPYVKCKRTYEQDMAGWWTWTCKLSSTGSITTG